MMQWNAPYAAGPHLAGFLESKGIQVVQADVSISLALKLFSRRGVQAILREVRKKRRRTAAIRNFLTHAGDYTDTIAPVVAFLQGRMPDLAHRIAERALLPEGPRFAVLDQTPLLEDMDVSDRAKYLASLYIDDLADVIREGVDSRFELSRYGEKLALSAPSFDPIRNALEGKPTLVDRLVDRMADELVAKHRPNLVGLTVPFPGNLYGALRLARRIKKKHPFVPVALGGGYINTELRKLSEPRLFDYVDFVTLDAGEGPLLCLAEHLGGKRPLEKLCRTFVRRRGAVVFLDGASDGDVPLSDTGVPRYEGLDMDQYLSLCELPNPMHRLWSDGRWNKLMLTHGCYWRKCAFCDTTLDYIRRFSAPTADVLVDRIEAIVEATGSRGFHFVDEAAPPALLRALAERLLARGVKITWWTNIRFEKAFSPMLCRLLAESGCVAVTGGLETAVDRLLRLMNKGISVETSARVMKAFADAGILVHAYLMYGFPSQTRQETVDALETVRQLFAAGCVQSAYWHRFALTVHSAMYREPGRFGIRLLPSAGTFAHNEVAYEDSVRCDHDALGEGMRKATYNYMHGVGLDFDVRSWFAGTVPKPTVRRGFVARAMR